MTRRRPTRATPLVTALACALVVQACGDASDEEAREVPPRQQPEVDVELIGEGVVSTEATEFAAAFTSNGDTLYFSRAPDRRARSRLFVSVRDSTGWGEPTALAFSKGRYRDADPFLAPDGSRLYFSSDRPAPVGAAGMNTWWVERRDDGWSEPRTAGPPLNSEAADVYVSLTRDSTLYFSSRRGDGTQSLYRIRLTAGGWERPSPVTFEQFESVGNPLIGPDGEFLVFVAAGPGSPDLYLVCPEGDGWSEPERLPKGINSAASDYAPALDPVDGTLVFTSERRRAGASEDERGTSGDLYRSPLRPADRCD